MVYVRGNGIKFYDGPNTRIYQHWKYSNHAKCVFLENDFWTPPPIKFVHGSYTESVLTNLTRGRSPRPPFCSFWLIFYPLDPDPWIRIFCGSGSRKPKSCGSNGSGPGSLALYSKIWIYIINIHFKWISGATGEIF